MDILTLGKMNAMARNTNQALELMANHLYESQQEICAFQAGNMDAVSTATAESVALIEAGAERGSGPMHSLYIGCSQFNGQTGGEGQNYNGWSCSWTVPDDVKSIKFEIYGAGASGYGSCCCMLNNLPGGAGGYAVKHINFEDGDFVIGDTYAICAGGTGCCWPHQHGVRGHTSYINGPGLSNFCAVGGHTAISSCASFWCYICCHTCYGCAPIYGADYGAPGQSSWRKSSQYCANDTWQVAANAAGPIAHGQPAFSPDGCVHGYHSGGGPSSPGAGAFGAQVAGGGCCCGKSGGGGGVLVTYWG